MQNPKSEPKPYLENRMRDVLDLHIGWQILSFFNEIKKNEELKLWRDYSSLFGFLQWTIISFVVIKLTTLLDEREKRGLIWYLNKAKKCPNQFNEEERFSDAQIDEQLNKIETFKDEINRIKDMRDKIFAHRDKKYVDSPEKIWDDYPNLFDDLTKLVQLTKEIFTEHSLRFLQVGSVENWTTQGDMQQFFGEMIWLRNIFNKILESDVATMTKLLATDKTYGNS